jgi:hypothetical protein
MSGTVNQSRLDVGSKTKKDQDTMRSLLDPKFPVSENQILERHVD